MILTVQDLFDKEIGETVVDAMSDQWTKAKDGLWEMHDPEIGQSVYLTSYQLDQAWGPISLPKRNPYGNIAYMGEDGQLHDLSAHIVDTDFTWTDQGAEARSANLITDYSTELRFTRVDPVNKAQQKLWLQLWLQLLAGSPRAELQDRLNARLRGDDLGKPINWKGL